ncbi:MAG: hypothetical protein R2835_03215 [Thermomicrobiales bacterium]
MLQRVYGTAWFTQEDLDAPAGGQRRRSSGWGRLELFTVSEEIGPGLILWMPNGATVRYLVEQFEQQEQLARGYQLVYTPHIASEKIYKISGISKRTKRICIPRCRSKRWTTTSNR